ncbi:DUF2529 family protein [Turicibacter sanguinis]|uniref:MurR/RpiR family transcriptional regulator n=1 Tax=Turicibacter sanguinis TaxID=154288 RepID=UPI0012BA2807|nr:MurR/RpiR family transcriptional regulator [Turicibacter sanguinis]MTH07175.1 DUF2529 family protein [Turicibacter sanguinis]MTH08497.1 DUF2529 family protein [Turicibacter sanguinis]MTH12002.1 DUF2529 family protein [Turicibacter sanguinis]MTH18453.1 DUF2529 family protein [Turicibacter sanguinis]MTH39442.1 DUF2529 family protein [Turicibacter sanguinis]
MTKNVLDKIFAVYDDLYEAEKKIATYILNNQEQVIEMTVSSLASASGASEATIIRFCKKCGYKGFHDLKMNIAKQMMNSGSVNSNDLNVSNLKQSLKNILDNKVDELTQTISLMDEKTVESVLDLLEKARVVQFAAVGNTIPVALDAAYKFNQIGISAVATPIHETQLALTYTLTEQDIIIVISNSGASKDLVTLIDAAKKHNIKVVGITNHDNSPIAVLCDYHITTFSRERLFFNEYCFSRISAMTVIEVLFLLLTSKKRDAYQIMNQHEQAMTDDKI